MKKAKFAYRVENTDSSFILILHNNETLNYDPKEIENFIFEENKLKEYIDKYPHSCSLYIDDETEQEALRLYEVYGLGHL